MRIYSYTGPDEAFFTIRQEWTPEHSQEQVEVMIANRLRRERELVPAGYFFIGKKREQYQETWYYASPLATFIPSP